MTNIVITVQGDTIEEVHERLRGMLPPAETQGFDDIPFQELLLKIDARVDAEGYEMDVWKKGSRPEPELPPSEKKKEEARAKLRGDLVASLAEATHATSVVKDEVEAEVEEKPVPKQPAKKAKSNGKSAESDEDRKKRIIVQLQDMYTAGRKTDVNKLLTEYGQGTRTFSAIPAEKFKDIEAALETL
jgi:hypothetical protein